MFLRFVRRYRIAFAVVGVCSVLLNLTAFAGPIYMLLVYDSVLPSRSLPTLFGLFMMLIVVYVFQVVFEEIRSKALSGIANGLRADVFRPVHFASVNNSLRNGKGDGDGMQPVRDLDQLHSFLSGLGPAAIIDMPWVILFLIVLTALHWSLGLTALVGALILAGLAYLTSQRTQSGTRALNIATGQRMEATQTEFRLAEAAWAMGMQSRLIERTRKSDEAFLNVQIFLARTLSGLTGASRSFRLLLQSVVLTAGALLVIDGQASGGIIIAASVLTGRALAPIDQAIANWRGFSASRDGWARIMEIIARYPEALPHSVQIARPTGPLSLRGIWVTPPGSQDPVISDLSLTVNPGQVLAVIGPSAAGKTSLARTLVGIWRPVRGEIRIDGATFDQWDPERLGASFGYVPQTVELADGTIAENIARFDPDASSETIIAAAKGAGMHNLILGLPDGYETRLSSGGFALSAGQCQRLGLARALYGDPHLVVLDEANSNLDAAGDEALARAIAGVRARMGIVVMVTHRPATLGPATHIAVMQGGRLADIGERDIILAKMRGEPAPAVPAP